MTLIKSPQNPRLKAVKRLHDTPRARSRSGHFLAEGEDLDRRRGARGRCACPIEGFRRGRARELGERGLPSMWIEPDADEGPLDARLGHARDRRLRAAMGRARDGSAVRLSTRRRRPGQRRHDPALRASAFGASQRRARARLCRPALAEGRAREHGRDLLCRSSRASATSVSELPRERVALVADEQGSVLGELSSDVRTGFADAARRRRARRAARRR